MNEEEWESEQVLFGQQSVFERDNASLIVASVAPRFKFNAKESVGCGTGAPSWQRSNECEGVSSFRGKPEVDVFLPKKKKEQQTLYLSFDPNH